MLNNFFLAVAVGLVMLVVFHAQRLTPPRTAGPQPRASGTPQRGTPSSVS